MAKTLTLQDMYIGHLKDMWSAETQILRTLPKMIKTASNSKLKRALEKHLKETEGHAARIEQVFQSLDASPRGKKCVGMEGLLEEGKEAMAQEYVSSDLMDSALIGGGQKVEHYEICGYRDLIHMAGLLGDNKAVNLLTKSLREEEAANQKLAELGETIVTREAVPNGQSR
ncbi:MAG TPA: ferritin-like domain-containing protein [Anaerolineales bacterium]|nr:ferritin-like domain-containing protein [Anaerolineales bacterium]